jgi:hypothetical protein
MIVLVLIAGASGCTSGTSAQHYQQLKTLQDLHVKFVDDFTTDTPQTVSGEKVASEAGKIDQQFQEAEEYAASTKDELRTSNVKLLHAMFDEDVSLLKEGKTFSKTYAGERKTKLLIPAYEKAMEGEKDR